MLKSVVAAACLCAGVAGAQASALSGQEISDLVAGATVEIDTPVGTKLPIRYTRDGKVSGEARDLASYLGAALDHGRWWVAGDQLCHRWNRWFNSEPQCLRLSKFGRLIRWYSADGNSGTATVSVPAAIQAGIVPGIAPPRVQPEKAKEAAPPEMPPAPASAPEKQPAEPATSAAGPALKAPEATVVQPPADAAPAPDPAALSESPPPQQPPEPAQAAPPMFKVVNVRDDDVLNVRSGPSADFDVIGELPPAGRGIAITGACRSQWCPVNLGSTSGWVNRIYLAPEGPALLSLPRLLRAGTTIALALPGLRDAPDAPRTCLTAAARALLDRIEEQFGAVKVISTCRPGALIAGTLHPSRHASGNAVDFLAGNRQAAIVEWLIANHRDGGTMTYRDMGHIHVDIGPHFVSIANGPHWLSWRDSGTDFPGPPAPAAGR